MKILEKIKGIWSYDNSSSCSAKECKTEKCKYTWFVYCIAKKFLFVLACFMIIAPVMSYFVAPKIIHRYLLNNPEAIIESVQQFSERKQKEAQQQSIGKIDEVYQDAIKDTSVPFVGNKNGSHVAVIFYDYSCGYCKKEAHELKVLSGKDSQLKLILKDLPLFGEKSVIASKASMYVFSKHPSKFENFHFKLMMAKDANEQTINSIAQSLGIEENIVMKSKSSFESEIRNNYIQAGEIRIDGTPAMIIKGKLHMGFKSADEISKLF
jgi:protein-disulfide isomerase